MNRILIGIAAASLLASAPALASAQALPRAKPVASGWKTHMWKGPDGTTFHWAEQGKGPPVILIHGSGGSALGNWFSNGFAQSLAKTNRVIGIDMRGHGLTTNPQGQRGDRTGDMAKDVLDFMDAQGIRKAHIGGYSMGGAITARLMARAPERFITAHFGGSGIGETAEWADKVPADKTGVAPEEEKARAAYYKIQAERQAAANAIGNAAPRRAGAAAPSPAAPAAAAPRPMPQPPAIDLRTITFPVLAVNGEYDAPYRKTHRLWRELPNFHNVVLKDGGHLSAVMEGFVPQLYIDELAAFIVRNNPRP
ncbi:alpha/beta hydrolase [Phenylobacterium sp.]|jgi:pimeloyl-ACP methyl ester carboxylesterase|uniref:alpha/beta fold hydrolase n=1 Tax=Phenylobacterium sp. TaxID=1871053 RepID=UPI002F9437DE